MVNNSSSLNYYLTHCILFIFILSSSHFTVASESECLFRQVNETTNDLRRQITVTAPPVTVSQKTKVASVTLKQLNVFNTQLESEDNALFRFANRAHIQTEPNVIENILLFKVGDIYNPKSLAESERLLRKQSFLYDAHISASENCDGNADIVVTTRDLWTLLPEISFSRNGGENKSSIGFRESNLFGWGKRVSFSRKTDNDRNGYLFIYDDPNILSSRYRGRLEYADNSDGKRHLVELTYPFYAIDTPYSYGLLSYSDQREEALYSRGEKTSEFEHTTDFNNVFFGHSKTLAANWTQRLSVGYIDEQHSFLAINTTTLPLAKDRSLSYPYISGHWFEDKFIKVRNFDSISRTEDLNLGWNIKATVGYSDQSISDDETRAIYGFSTNKAHFSNNNTLWRFYSDIEGYWNKEQKELENLIATTQIQYYLNTHIDESWYIKTRLQYAKNLTNDKQLTLGGESGLRGYPMDFQHGDRSFLLSIEKRYYWEYDLLQLFKVGAAAYLDVGRAWLNKQATPTDESRHVLKNIGIGLRLAPSRANAGTMIHLDIAAPLNTYDDVDTVQWLLSVKNSF